MTAEYYLDISMELLEDIDAVREFGRITPPVTLIRPCHVDFARDMQRWLVRDEGSPQELDGCLVDITLKQHYKVTNKGQLHEHRELGPLHVMHREVRIKRNKYLS